MTIAELFADHKRGTIRLFLARMALGLVATFLSAGVP